GDVCDNCPLIDNDDQMNQDQDTFGDACDNCPTEADYLITHRFRGRRVNYFVVPLELNDAVVQNVFHQLPGFVTYIYEDCHWVELGNEDLLEPGKFYRLFHDSARNIDVDFVGCMPDDEPYIVGRCRSLFLTGNYYPTPIPPQNFVIDGAISRFKIFLSGRWRLWFGDVQPGIAVLIQSYDADTLRVWRNLPDN
ncbi:MAG: hypothetical protein GY869_17780, partial [Planctomycetes bacterium]|nr:hypothetical protein [Planctomycetota bacterium]